MSHLVKDILLNIFEYCDYLDYATFCQVNTEWEQCIKKYTNYSKFLEYSNICGDNKTLIFYKLCKDSQIKTAYWFYQHYKKDIENEIYFAIFKECYSNKNYSVAQFIYSLNEMDGTAVTDNFKNICYNNDTDTIRWYYNLIDFKRLNSNFLAFKFTCYCGNLIIFQNCSSLDELDMYTKDHNDCLDGHKNTLKTFDRNNVKCSVIKNHNTRPEYYFDLPDRRVFGTIIYFTDINIYFTYHCQNNNVKTIIELYETFPINIHFSNSIALQIAVNRGHIDVLRYLYSLGARLDNYQFLYLACKGGQMRVVELAISNKFVDELDDITKCFQIACYKNHFEIAKCLYASYSQKINLFDNDSIIFRICCEKGYLNFVIWLSKLNIDITAKNNDAFRLSCLENHLEIMQFLYSSGKINIFMNNNQIMDICCYKCYLNIIAWMFTLEDVDKSLLYSIIFNKACKYGQYNIVQWLYLNDRTRYLEMANENFEIVIETDNEKIAKFLLANGNISINDRLIKKCERNSSYSVMKCILEKM